MNLPLHRVRPFSFAVQAPPARHIGEWRRLARAAQDLGYRALLLPDHVGSGGPVSGASVAGAVTESLRVGTLMLGVDFNRPVALVQELMTMDALLDGRLEIGLGAGWLRSDYERSGLAMDTAGTRIARLSDFVVLLRRAWRQAVAQSDDAPLGPTPHSAAPFLSMGGGGRRMLELATDHADVVSLSATMHTGVKESRLGRSAHRDAFAERSAWVADRATHRERRPELQCLVYQCRVTDDADCYVAAEVRDSFGLTTEEVRQSPLALVGTADELCRTLEHHREHLGISYWVIKSNAMREFAPVVERLAGR